MGSILSLWSVLHGTTATNRVFSTATVAQSMFTDPVTINGCGTHFVRQVSATAMLVVAVAVSEAPCEQTLTHD